MGILHSDEGKTPDPYSDEGGEASMNDDKVNSDDRLANGNIGSDTEDECEEETRIASLGDQINFPSDNTLIAALKDDFESTKLADETKNFSLPSDTMLTKELRDSENSNLSSLKTEKVAEVINTKEIIVHDEALDME